MVDASLEELLATPLHKFWSQLTHDDSLQVMIDSLLRYRRRAFDLVTDAVAAPGGTRQVRVNEVAVERLEEKLLQVLVRMSSPDGFGSQIEIDGEKLSSGAHSSLLYDTWLVDVPKLLDVCAVYSAGLVLHSFSLLSRWPSLPSPLLNTSVLLSLRCIHRFLV